MTNINLAYAVLSDFEKRRKYDLSRGVPANFSERRGLAAQSLTPGKQRPQEHAPARLFAFRPLA
jgi:curved DNA-binding protein CbpA